MKIAFLADVHIGNHKRFGGPVEGGINRRCHQVIAALNLALRGAVKAGCEAAVICGDLFDSSSPGPQVLAAVLDVLRTLRAEAFAANRPPLALAILVGNHDQFSDSDGDHALGVLRDYALIVERPELLHFDRAQGGWTQGPAGLACRTEWRTFELFAVPFSLDPGKAVVRRAFSQLAYPEGSPHTPPACRIAAVHLGISDDKTAPWLKNASDSIDADTLAELMDEHGVSTTFAGNWHDRRAWGDPPFIIQCGALVPTGWDNPGLAGYGGVEVYDTDTQTSERFEVPGPRFVKLTAGQTISGNAIKPEHLYVQVAVAPGDPIPEGVVPDGAPAAFDVIVDQTADKIVAAAAAEAARSSETFDEALEAFLTTMPLADGIDREEVRGRVKKYMAKVGS